MNKGRKKRIAPQGVGRNLRGKWPERTKATNENKRGRKQKRNPRMIAIRVALVERNRYKNKWRTPKKRHARKKRGQTGAGVVR